jgi:hypothetical protein
MTSAGKSTTKRLRFSLLSSRRDLWISPELAAAEWDQLRAFVAEIREEYGFWWPVGARPSKGSTAWPWPECWDQHAGFVSALRLLQSWDQELATGQAEGGPREGRDCLLYLRDDIGGMVRVISGRTCRYGHVDVTAEPGGRERESQGAPPLPGQSVPAPGPQLATLAPWWSVPDPGTDLVG